MTISDVVKTDIHDLFYNKHNDLQLLKIKIKLIKI